MAINIETYHQGIMDAITDQAEDNSSTAIGNAFCQWCLENIFDLTEDQALDAREMSGGFDHSIDAIHEFDDKIIVLQAKFEDSHDWSQVTKFHYDMERIKKGKVRPGEANARSERAIVKILEGYKNGLTIEYYYVTSGSFTEVDRKKIATLPGYQADMFFYDLYEIVGRQEDRQNEDVPASVKNRWFELRSSTPTGLSFGDSAVVAVPLSQMHDFVAEGGNDLFASNVRQYLGRTKINQEIKRTIQDDPEKFWLYNNGITIVCDDFNVEGTTLRIKSPQIVNGCQTAKTIWEILSKKTLDERRDIGGAVLSRVIKGADTRQKDNITRFTNTQNAIRGKDFFSLTKFHKNLHKAFTQFGYYYEIQRGSYTSLKASQRSRFNGIPELAYLNTRRHKFFVPASEAIQAFAAAFKDIPAIAYARPNELVPNGAYYDRVIEDNLKEEPRLFLYPYLVGEWAKSHGYSRSSDNRSGDGRWRAHATLFFVHVYYIFVLELLKAVRQIDPLEIHPEQVPDDIWDSIFRDEKLNTKLLETTDAMLENFFIDTGVVELVGSDVRQFLRTHELLSRTKPIISRIVGTAIGTSRNRELRDRFAATVRATT